MTTTIIEGTKVSPNVELNPTGKLTIQGRSIVEDTTTFYKPIIDWADRVECFEMTVSVKLEYMNTSSSKQLLTILKTIATNPRVKSLYVKWYYEADDEDMLDMGQDFESLIHVPFDFYELSVEEV
jgi:hypothetical protein